MDTIENIMAQPSPKPLEARMTNVKMPDSSYCCCIREPIYTKAQLKQYGDDRAREALEMAAKVAGSKPLWNAGYIRALAKEIK